MKLNKIIKTVNDIVGLQLPSSYFEPTDVTGPNNEIVQKLIACANFVLEQLYCEYATAISKCVVTSDNKTINTTAIKLNRVISLVGADGYEAKYRYTEKGLEVDNDGTFNLTYAKRPEELSWLSDVVLPSPRVTERIFSYGIISEYYTTIGDYSNAQVWHQKFEDALLVANVKTSNMIMPAWRWL